MARAAGPLLVGARRRKLRGFDDLAFRVCPRVDSESAEREVRQACAAAPAEANWARQAEMWKGAFLMAGGLALGAGLPLGAASVEGTPTKSIFSTAAGALIGAELGFVAVAIVIAPGLLAPGTRDNENQTALIATTNVPRVSVAREARRFTPVATRGSTCSPPH